MRFLILVFAGSFFVSGCASNQLHDQYRAAASSLGVDQEEVAAVARQAGERHKLFVIEVKSADGAIVVSLSHVRTPPFPNWIEVTFRKIDGRWQEDPKSQRELIV